MFFDRTLAVAALSASLASACDPLLYKRDGYHPRHIMKRAHLPNPVVDNRGWAFDQSEEWNTLNPDWGVCFCGSQQSPIALDSSIGLAMEHIPEFSYPTNLSGVFNNWDFGPSWALNSNTPNTSLPKITFDDYGKSETVYLTSWHVHAPAEHTIDGYRPKAEMHFVHYNKEGSPRAVVGFFIDRYPNGPGSDFFAQLPKIPTIFDNVTISDVSMNLNLALAEVNNYENFFTYKGSLTTPPCTEGLRWFMSQNIIFVNDAQMQDLLAASTFGARPINPVWLHEVNQ